MPNASSKRSHVRMTNTMGKFRFYHGTHSGVLDQILTNGLAPRGSASAFAGNLSDIGGFTEHQVFLAPAASEAAFYAIRNAEEHPGTEPVVFEVILDTDAQLSTSDDYRNAHAIAAMLKSLGLPPLQYDEDGDVHQYGTSSDAYYSWREVLSTHAAAIQGGEDPELDDSELDELGFQFGEDDAKAAWSAMKVAHVDAAKHDWRASIAGLDPSVAHKGPIAIASLRQLQGLELTCALREAPTSRVLEPRTFRVDLDVVEPQKSPTPSRPRM